MKKATSIASKAIIIYHNKYLLQLRDNKETISSPNTWGFFGGKINVGESAEDGLKRELIEELNYNIINSKYICNHFFLSLKVVVNFFSIHIKNMDDIVTFSEGQRMEWFTIDEIKSLKKANDLIYALTNKFIS